MRISQEQLKRLKKSGVDLLSRAGLSPEEQAEILDPEKVENEKKFSRWKQQRKYAGWREINGLKIYFPNRMEANLYRYYDWLAGKGIIQYFVYCNDKGCREKHTFKFGGRGATSYLPDFFIQEDENNSYYIEAKGYLSASDKAKMNKMAKYFPKVRVEILTWDRYKGIEAQVGQMIPGWVF